MSTDYVKQFWEGYHRALIENQIPISHRRLYVRHIERLIRFSNGARIAEHPPSFLRYYLTELSNQGYLEPWRYRQHVDALRVLYLFFLKPAWAKIFEWAYWQNTTVSRHFPHKLAPNHSALPTPPSLYICAAQQDLKIHLQGRNYSIKTQQSYQDWLRRLLTFHKPKKPAEIASEDVKSFLAHIAVDRKVSIATQKQAMSAIVYYFRHIQKQDWSELGEFIRTQPRRSKPQALSREEVQQLIRSAEGMHYTLIFALLYGCGLRLMECLRLRIEDFNFESLQIAIKRSKGREDRHLPIPKSFVNLLQSQQERVAALHRADIASGYGYTTLPASDNGTLTSSSQEWQKQFFFPSNRITQCQGVRERVRLHIHPSSVQKYIAYLGKQLSPDKRVSCHMLRHSYATHLLENGEDIRHLRDLLGHASVSTTMMYTQPNEAEEKHIASPIDDGLEETLELASCSQGS